MSRRPDDLDATAYEIRVTGHLDGRWTDRFEGLSLRQEPDGTTVITGPVADQAALHGLLQRVRDLGIPLVSVTRIEPSQPTTLGTKAGVVGTISGN